VEGVSPLAPGSALARALARDRDRFNARVALAGRRRDRGRLDPSRLTRHLVERLAPVMEAVEAVAPRSVDAVCAALFDLSLDLVAREVMGAEGRHACADAAWRETLPRLASHLAAAPGRVAAAVTNAALQLELEPTVNAASWLDALAAAAPRCPDVDALLAAGQVLAWRAGMAHWRETAVKVWDRLPDGLASVVLGLDPAASPPRPELRRALDDPFRTPGAPPGVRALRLLGTVGGFRGFGGPFLAPPRLASDGQRLWALDGADGFTLHADCFGRTVVRAQGAPADLGAPAEPLRLAPDGTLSYRGLTSRFATLAGARCCAAAGPLVAALPPHTHRVALVALTTGAG
jgi:hypothetical protein